MSDAVVVTGMGAVSPLGSTVAEFCDGLVRGESALGLLRTIDVADLVHPAGGEVRGFEPDARLPAGASERLDRVHQYALAAALEALADAGLDAAADRTGVALATTLGSMETIEAFQADPDGVDPFRLADAPYHAAASRLARELGARGPVASPSIACASGTAAVSLGLDWIRAGRADAVVVGGVERICRFVVTGFDCLRATSPTTLRPFDRRRDGLLVGEGAAVLVLERESIARRRGAPVDVHVAGAGLSSDAFHMTAPARDGAGAARAMSAALRDAGLSRDDVDFVSVHGTGTVYNDAMEMAALGAVLGQRIADVPVTGIKGAIGHTLGAAGAFEAIQCVSSLRTGVLPPTANLEELDPECPLDVVHGESRRIAARVALSTSSAFAGNNAAIVLTRRVSHGG